MMDEKLKDVVRELVDGTQEEMDEKMDRIAKGLYEKLKRMYPNAPEKDTIEFAKASAVAMLRTTATTMK